MGKINGCQSITPAFLGVAANLIILSIGLSLIKGLPNAIANVSKKVLL